MRSTLVLIFVANLCTIISLYTVVNGQNIDKVTDDEILSKIIKNNVHKSRPMGTDSSDSDHGGPVLVTVNMYIRNIRNVNEMDMKYSAQVTFREEWTDARLAYKDHWKDNDRVALPPFIVLPHDQQIWKPDTFFQNELDARKHNVDTANQLIRVYSNGKILYSVRLSMTFSCPMSLEYYPFDRQQCMIDVASYSFTTSDIVYKWKETNPVQLKMGLSKSIPNFILEKSNTTTCTSKTATGEYSCLRTIFWLDRSYGSYVINYFVPKALLVLISWISFWINKEAVSARVTLLLITLLIMTIQTWGVNGILPQVSYVKAIDVWNGTCWMFLFAALIEFAVVNYFFQREVAEEEKKRQKRLAAEYPGGVVIEGSKMPLLHDRSERVVIQPEEYNRPQSFKSASTSQKIEIVCRFLFPVCFLIFNIIYWPLYLC